MKYMIVKTIEGLRTQNREAKQKQKTKNKKQKTKQKTKNKKQKTKKKKKEIKANQTYRMVIHEEKKKSDV